MDENTRQMSSTETRRLAAIMFTDMVGFSRQMGSNEARTLRLLAVHNQVIQQAVAEHRGAVIKTVGDAFLVDFPSVVHAVQCAQQIQTQFRAHNADKEPAEQIHVRIGIHSGDIVQKDGDVFGDGVNIASRLQALAEPDTICISHVVYQEVEKKLALGAVVSLGRPKLKNITQRQPVYALLPEQSSGLRHTLRALRLTARRVGTAHLTRAALVVVGLLIGGGIITLWFPSLSPFRTPHSALRTQEAQPPLLPLPDKPSIAVLPFTNISGDPEQEYFSDGLTDDLITDLSKISGLFVIARNSVFTYKGKAVNIEEVGRELGVRYVLEGSTRKADSRVRINAQLVDAATGGHLWAERYDRELKDLFALQDEITQEIIRALRVEVQEAERERVRRIPTANLTAYDAWLRGVEYFWRFTKDDNGQARQLFERAIELDPQYADAYAWLGWTYWQEFWWNQDPQLLERAGELAQHALTLDDSLPDAHVVLGYVYQWQKQPEQAIAEGERAIALDPNYANAYVMLADILSWAGRPEEAIGLVQQAMRLNPRYPAYYPYTLGTAYIFTGQYDEAIAATKEARRLNPNDPYVYYLLAWSYEEQWIGQWSQEPQTLERAEEAAQQGVALGDSVFWTHGPLSLVYLWQRRYEEAMAEAERAVALNPTEAESQAYLGNVLNFVGRPDDTLEMMEKATCSTALFWPAFCFSVLGEAYYLTRRYEEAIGAFKQALNHKPLLHLGLEAHLGLAASYSELSREEEARAEAAEVLRLNPNFSLEVHKQRVPIKDPAVLERQLAALRQAGLK